jgi:hypothetical protein
MPQGDNLTGFGRHNNEISESGREIKRTLTALPCEQLALEGQRFKKAKLNFAVIFVSFRRWKISDWISMNIWNRYWNLWSDCYVCLGKGARGSVVVEALSYKPEGQGIASRWGGCDLFCCTIWAPCLEGMTNTTGDFSRDTQYVVFCLKMKHARFSESPVKIYQIT